MPSSKLLLYQLRSFILCSRVEELQSLELLSSDHFVPEDEMIPCVVFWLARILRARKIETHLLELWRNCRFYSFSFESGRILYLVVIYPTYVVFCLSEDTRRSFAIWWVTCDEVCPLRFLFGVTLVEESYLMLHR